MLPSNYIIHGSAYSELRRMPNDYVSCCVTEPPEFKSGNMSCDGYALWLEGILSEVKRVLRPDGTMWLILRDAYHNKNLMGLPWRVAFTLQNSGWILRQDVVLHKMNTPVDTLHDRCPRAHDYIFTFAKSSRYYFDREAIAEAAILEPERERKRSITRDLKMTIKKDRRSVWSVIADTTCPPEIIERCVLAGCPDGGLVLDPFFGSGTVGLTCIKHNRQFIGIDSDENCCRIADQRINAALAATAPLSVGEFTMEDLSWGDM